MSGWATSTGKRKDEGVAGTLNLHNVHVQCWTDYLTNWFVCLKDCQIFLVSLVCFFFC